VSVLSVGCVVSCVFLTSGRGGGGVA